MNDFRSVLAKRLANLLETVNNRIGKNYRLLTDQPDTFIAKTLELAESISNEDVMSTYLKIIVTAMKLNQPDKLSPALSSRLKETKSINLLPLRVIVNKLKNKL